MPDPNTTTTSEAPPEPAPAGADEGRDITPTESIDWGGLAEATDDDSQDIPLVAEAPEAPAPEPTPAPPAPLETPAPVAETPPPAEPQPPPPAEPAQPTPAPVPQAAPDPTREPVAPVAPEAQRLTEEEWAARSQKYEQDLAAHYAVSKEDADALVTEPEKVLPRLAARVHRSVLESTVVGVMAHLPRYIEQHLASQQTYKANEQDFFGKWPALQKPEYQDAIRRIGSAYRLTNPMADKTRAIEEIGAMAMFQLGLVPTGTQVPLAPARPFAPAAPGGTPASRPAPGTKQGNEWEQLANELVEDDQAA